MNSLTKTTRQFIDFFILDPNYKVVFRRSLKDEGIFRLNTTMKGQYSFIFSSMGDRINTKTVTVAIHPGFEDEISPQKQLKYEKEIEEMS